MGISARGLCTSPGLVIGEACRVRVLRLGPNVDYIGPDRAVMPDELFDRALDATVLETCATRFPDRFPARARLVDPWIRGNLHPALRRLYGAEPPSPFPYTVTPVHFLNGWTRDGTIRTGNECWIWIRAEGAIPWLERRPSAMPEEFPGYPHEHLVGFWRARVTAILRPKGPTPARKLRAVLLDERIRSHADPRVRALYGHEPWAEYDVTLSDDELAEAGGAMFDDLAAGAKRVLDRMPKVELPWMNGGGSEGVWQPDDFLET